MLLPPCIRLINLFGPLYRVFGICTYLSICLFLVRCIGNLFWSSVSDTWKNSSPVQGIRYLFVFIFSLYRERWRKQKSLLVPCIGNSKIFVPSIGYSVSISIFIFIGISNLPYLEHDVLVPCIGYVKISVPCKEDLLDKL